MKQLILALALSVLSGCGLTPVATDAGAGAGNGPLTPEDKHALQLGYQVYAVEAALQSPEAESSIDAVRKLGLQTRHYVMVRGWILQHISMAESYRRTTAYRESEQRKSEVDGRIAALQEMLRAIDLE
jgi:hypothetical protein